MDLDTLIKKLDIGETSDFECKAAENELPKDAWKTISAFANTNGGYLVLGITEKKGKFYPSGIKNAAYQQQNFWNAHNDKTKINIPLIDESNVNEIKIDDLSIIVIKVPRASRTQRPVYINNNPNTGTFKRQGEGDYLCTELEVRQMLRDANDRPQDSLILENFGLNDIDRDALKAFRNRFSSRDPDHPFLALDDLGMLEKLGAWKQDRISKNEGLTIAGLLMFGKEQSILEELPHYFLDYQERPSIDSTEWTYRLTSGDGRWEVNLFNFYYKIYNRLVVDLDVPFKLDENAIRTGETSVHKAIREAVANTLIHADHSATQAITIIKHKDSFLFSNPGCLRISVEQLFAGGQSDPRNPNIQTMFRMIGLGERAGSGFPRIIQACQEQQWIGPVVSGALDLNRTTVILLMVSLIPEEVDRDLRQIAGNEYCSLSELDRMILFLAHRLTDISNNNIQQYSQKHPRDIGDCLKHLVQKGYLAQSGSGRGTHYSLAKVQPNSDRLDVNPDHLNVNPDHLDVNPDHLDVNLDHLDVNPDHLNVNPDRLNVSPDRLEKLKVLATPVRDKGNVPEIVMRQAILDVCREDFLTPRQMEEIFNRKNLRLRFLSPMVKEELLELRYPDNPSHPEQAYRTRQHQTEVIK
jgi:ATP-dependent DNA helicase RecG